MNVFVSKALGLVMSLLHVAVIFILAASLMVGTIDTTRLIMIGGLAIGYVLLVGIVCTLLACREHLETLIIRSEEAIDALYADKSK
jgi:hypothetical protein